jgi:hypothetical protein
MGSKWTLGRLVGGYGVDSPGSGLGQFVGSPECGGEPSGSGATELANTQEKYFLHCESTFH